MNDPKVSIIVAVSENNIIGKKGGLPWHLSSDLKRFRKLTTGHVIVMGRNTWESIGRPLPDRASIVVSRSSDFHAEGAIVVSSLKAALKHAKAIAKKTAEENENVFPRFDQQVFIIGGAQLYEAALPTADKLYWTRVRASVEGDVAFPEIDWSEWTRFSQESIPAGEKDDHATLFQIWERA